jgi:hypothetical protein
MNSRLDRIASVLVTAGLVFAAVTATAGVARADSEGSMPTGCAAIGLKPALVTVGKQTREAGNTCDGGGTTQYYSEAGWDTYVDVIEDTTWQRVQRVSKPAKFAHC